MSESRPHVDWAEPGIEARVMEICEEYLDQLHAGAGIGIDIAGDDVWLKEDIGTPTGESESPGEAGE